SPPTREHGPSVVPSRSFAPSTCVPAPTWHGPSTRLNAVTTAPASTVTGPLVVSNTTSGSTWANGSIKSLSAGPTSEQPAGRQPACAHGPSSDGARPSNS